MRESDDRLEDFSRNLARELSARHNEWKVYIGSYSVVGPDGLIDRFLELRIPSEHPQIDSPLLVKACRTDGGDEVYLEWDGWHDHVMAWAGQTRDELIRQAVDLVELWTSDCFLFARLWRGDKIVEERGSPYPPDKPDFWETPEGTTLVVRSWRGTHDQTLVQSPA